MPIATAAPLLAWTDEPRSDAGLRVLGADGETWTYHPYTELADLVRGTSRRLGEAGVRPGQTVAIADPDALGFVAGFFGALHAGATPVPLPPRAPRADEHAALLGAILEAARPGAILTGGGLRDVAAQVAPQHVPVLDGLAVPAADHPAARAPEIALLQFTSGSTGRPRGVRVTGANVAAHAAMARDWLGWGPDDAAASWLPLHHDMGLVGLLLTSVIGQSDLWQMRPEQFLWQPHRWIACFDGPHGAAITAAPTFGYGYAARRVRAEQLEGLDLSGWRSAVVGAERLVPAPLQAFSRLLAPHGFRPHALRPAFGLAEATLAVTGSDQDEPPRATRVDWRAMDGERPLMLAPVVPLEELADETGALLSCGRPLDDLTVGIVDDDDRPVPDGVLGEVTVRGATVAAGYLGGATSTVTRFVDGRLHTGDAGFLHDGELFVVGRMADGIKVNGQRIHAETVEQRVAVETGVPAHRCVVVPSPAADGDGLAVLLEDVDLERVIPATERAVRAVVGPATEVTVHALPRGAIARTTSGKPRRREMWRRVAGGTPADVV